MYTFYLDQKEEITVLNKMLSGWSGCTVAERAEQYHIPLKIAEKCSKEKIPQELIDYVQKTYQEKKKDLEKALTFHTDFWNRNSAKCQEKLIKLMEQEIPPFRVRLQVLCDGISDWMGTNVAINAFEYLNGNPVWYTTLLWETILAVTFQRIRRKYSKTIYADNIVWAVSEMSACAIINTDFNTVWNIGYRQLFPHQEKVMQFYKNRKNFSDFLEKQLSYFKDKDIQI